MNAHLARHTLADIRRAIAAEPDMTPVYQAEDDFIAEAKASARGAYATDDLHVLAEIAETIERTADVLAAKFAALSAAEDPEDRFKAAEVAKMFAEMLDPHLRFSALNVVRTRIEANMGGGR